MALLTRLSRELGKLYKFRFSLSSLKIVLFISLDMKKQRLEFDLDIPKLRIDAQYNLKGQILLLPIVGNGDVAMTLKNVKTTVKTKFSLKNLPEVCNRYVKLLLHHN